MIMEPNHPLQKAAKEFTELYELLCEARGKLADLIMQEPVTALEQGWLSIDYTRIRKSFSKR